jgi:hypothetical protein
LIFRGMILDFPHEAFPIVESGNGNQGVRPAREG